MSTRNFFFVGTLVCTMVNSFVVTDKNIADKYNSG